MEKSDKNIIKYFSDRFLNISEYPDKIEEVCELPLSSFKGLDNEVIEKLNILELKKIQDLAVLSDEDAKNLIKTNQFDPINFKKALIGSRLISKSLDKRNKFMNDMKSKILITGLSKAGKKTFIKKLLKRKNQILEEELEPGESTTKAIETSQFHMILWNLEKKPKNQSIQDYLNHSNQHFLKVDILIFIVDSQDDGNYDKAINYLDEICEIFSFLEEKPYTIVLLNKIDPGLRTDSDFQIKLEYLEDLVQTIFNNNDLSGYELVKTNLLNAKETEPEVLDFIKRSFKTSRTQVEDDESDSKMDKFEKMENSIQKILEGIVKYLDKFGKDLKIIKEILMNQESQGLKASLPVKAPKETKIPSPPAPKESPQANLNKLKEQTDTLKKLKQEMKKIGIVY